MIKTHSEAEEQLLKTIIDETMETLAYTIDAKDRYTRGHSFRVAKYARQIARLSGKSESQCREIYLAGLLHDIGKISISDSIINKYGKLTDAEYEQMKLHTINGAKILEKMKSVPYLQNGALYHHERYDGKGYPIGLQGEMIPEMARIIAVADAYDTMTSNRSYRGAYDQGVVKHEIWKGMGTQFDPYFAKVMISLIDADINYDMREKPDSLDSVLYGGEDEPVVWRTFVPKNMLETCHTDSKDKVDSFGAYVKAMDAWENPSEAVLIEENEKVIEISSVTDKMAEYLWCVPFCILFAADDSKISGIDYDELGVFCGAGYSWKSGSSIRETTKVTKSNAFTDWDDWIKKNKEGIKYKFTVRRDKNIVFIKLENDMLTFTADVLLPVTYKRDIYVSCTAERCKITNINIV